jgi:hypothetical protein
MMDAAIPTEGCISLHCVSAAMYFFSEMLAKVHNDETGDAAHCRND